MNTPKRPRDPNMLAKMIVDMSTAAPVEAVNLHSAPPRMPEKNAAAVELGRLGGLKGGKARAASLSDEDRKSIAKRAANARWSRQ